MQLIEQQRALLKDSTDLRAGGHPPPAGGGGSAAPPALRKAPRGAPPARQQGAQRGIIKATAVQVDGTPSTACPPAPQQENFADVHASNDQDPGSSASAAQGIDGSCQGGRPTATGPACRPASSHARQQGGRAALEAASAACPSSPWTGDRPPTAAPIAANDSSLAGLLAGGTRGPPSAPDDRLAELLVGGAGSSVASLEAKLQQLQQHFASSAWAVTPAPRSHTASAQASAPQQQQQHEEGRAPLNSHPSLPAHPAARLRQPGDPLAAATYAVPSLPTCLTQQPQRHEGRAEGVAVRGPAEPAGATDQGALRQQMQQVGLMLLHGSVPPHRSAARRWL